MDPFAEGVGQHFSLDKGTIQTLFGRFGETATGEWTYSRYMWKGHFLITKKFIKNRHSKGSTMLFNTETAKSERVAIFRQCHRTCLHWLEKNAKYTMTQQHTFLEFTP